MAELAAELFNSTLAAQDPTALAKAERDLYHAMVESLAEGLLITDRESRIVYANHPLEKILGRDREQLLGKLSYEVLLPPDQWDAMKRRLGERLEGTPEDYEMKIVRGDGAEHWVSIKATAYKSCSGEIIGTIGAISCIQARKQLVAHAIHDLSPRKASPLVRVNCASIPKELFESEFFGHVRGAFTGAIKDRIGRFELANGGTLFLDEIGEIPMDLQSKLLRVLQEGQFERLGEERTRTVKVRVVAATNRDLLAEAKAGRFRLDLCYRVSVFPIDLPPLRERTEDIGLLAEHFLAASSRRLGVPRPRLSQAALQELLAYDWPGNIRELQNVIERTMILARGGRLQFDLPHAAFAKPPQPLSTPTPLEEALSLDELIVRERAIITTALSRTSGKIYGLDGAAALLKIKPTTLVSKIKRLSIK